MNTLSRLSFCTATFTMLLASACTKNPAPESSLPIEAKPYKGQVYRTKDSSQTITLVSEDELEINKDGANVICKYTKQDDRLRVVVNILGTPQAFYYRMTDDGLEDANGLIFYNSVRFQSVDQLAQPQQEMDKQWAQVYSVYQRRADLITNLANILSGVASFNKSTLTALTDARTATTEIKIDQNQAPSDPALLAKYNAAQSRASAALSRMIVESERYSELKSNSDFNDLLAQLEGTENRISVARQDFNISVQKYNAALPAGSRQRPFFAASAQRAQ